MVRERIHEENRRWKYNINGADIVDVNADNATFYKTLILPDIASGLVSLPGTTNALSLTVDTDQNAMLGIPLDLGTLRLSNSTGDHMNLATLDATGKVPPEQLPPLGGGSGTALNKIGTFDPITNTESSTSATLINVAVPPSPAYAHQSGDYWVVATYGRHDLSVLAPTRLGTLTIDSLVSLTNANAIANPNAFYVLETSLTPGVRIQPLGDWDGTSGGLPSVDLVHGQWMRVSVSGPDPGGLPASLLSSVTFPGALQEDDIVYVNDTGEWKYLATSTSQALIAMAGGSASHVGQYGLALLYHHTKIISDGVKWYSATARNLDHDTGETWLVGTSLLSTPQSIDIPGATVSPLQYGLRDGSTITIDVGSTSSLENLNGVPGQQHYLLPGDRIGFNTLHNEWTVFPSGTKNVLTNTLFLPGDFIATNTSFELELLRNGAVVASVAGKTGAVALTLHDLDVDRPNLVTSKSREYNFPGPSAAASQYGGLTSPREWSALTLEPKFSATTLTPFSVGHYPLQLGLGGSTAKTHHPSALMAVETTEHLQNVWSIAAEVYDPITRDLTNVTQATATDSQRALHQVVAPDLTEYSGNLQLIRKCYSHESVVDDRAPLQFAFPPYNGTYLFTLNVLVQEFDNNAQTLTGVYHGVVGSLLNVNSPSTGDYVLVTSNLSGCELYRFDGVTFQNVPVLRQKYHRGQYAYIIGTTPATSSLDRLQQHQGMDVLGGTDLSIVASAADHRVLRVEGIKEADYNVAIISAELIVQRNLPVSRSPVEFGSSLAPALLGTFNFHPQILPPSAPELIGVGPGLSSGFLQVDWVDHGNHGSLPVLEYRIYLGAGSSAALQTAINLGMYTTETPPTTAFLFSTLVPGTTYYVKVSAVNAEGESQFSNELTGVAQT